MATLSHDEINRLSVAERLALMGDLWDSLDDAQIALSPAQAEELTRRLETFESDIKDGVTWEQLKTELASRAS